MSLVSDEYPSDDTLLGHQWSPCVRIVHCMKNKRKTWKKDLLNFSEIWVVSVMSGSFPVSTHVFPETSAHSRAMSVIRDFWTQISPINSCPVLNFH